MVAVILDMLGTVNVDVSQGIIVKENFQMDHPFITVTTMLTVYLWERKSSLARYLFYVLYYEKNMLKKCGSKIKNKYRVFKIFAPLPGPKVERPQ